MSPPDNRQLARIKLAAFDVDGVFTDGRFYLADDGTETKAFSTLDGYGIRRLLEAGVEVAIISGRESAAVRQRMAELGVSHLYLGCKDKTAAFDELLTILGLQDEQCLYAGDDIPDLPLLRRVGVAVAVANAHREVLGSCDMLTSARGGFGAVREICDHLLDAQNSQAGGE